LPRPGSTERLVIPELPHKAEGSPLIRLIGDEFATNAEASLYLLTDLTSEIGGGVLTNNNTVTFNFDAEHGYVVGDFVSASSQSLTRTTETQFEVGTGSFIVSEWFKTTATATQSLFCYGDIAASEQNYNVEISSGGNIRATVDDGTNNITLSDPIAGRWNDDKWHCMVMFVDRTTDIMYLFVDGLLTISGSISTVTLTFNNVGTDMRIGARTSATVAEAFWNGSLANFHIIKAADYNAVQVLNQGIREEVNNGGVLTLQNDTNARFNNGFFLANADLSYATAVIDVEEGEYEIQGLFKKFSSHGIAEFLIDEIVVLTQDQFNASVLNNNFVNVTGIKLSAGKHIFKLKTNGQNGSSSGFNNLWYWISFIKRKGHEQGGATKFLLLGDELIERNNDAWTLITNVGEQYNNSLFLDAADAEGGEFTEGEIFIRGGLYNIEVRYDGAADRGRLDVDFGNVEVVDDVDTSGANATVAKLVRLNQGKNNIRVAIGTVTDGSDFEIAVVSIRGERISD